MIRFVMYGDNEGDCWHECPKCHREWRHVVNSLRLDEYFQICPSCLTESYDDGPPNISRRKIQP